MVDIQKKFRGFQQAFIPFFSSSHKHIQQIRLEYMRGSRRNNTSGARQFSHFTIDFFLCDGGARQNLLVSGLFRLSKRLNSWPGKTKRRKNEDWAPNRDRNRV